MVHNNDTVLGALLGFVILQFAIAVYFLGSFFFLALSFQR